jgi:hypothetical protein
VKSDVANTLNLQQSLINRSMLDVASSVTYEVRSFVESDVFKSLVANAVRTANISLNTLANKGYLNRRLSGLLTKNQVTTLGQLFSNPKVGPEAADAVAARSSIIDKLLRSARPLDE